MVPFIRWMYALNISERSGDPIDSDSNPDRSAFVDKKAFSCSLQSESLIWLYLTRKYLFANVSCFA